MWLFARSLMILSQLTMQVDRTTSISAGQLSIYLSFVFKVSESNIHVCCWRIVLQCTQTTVIDRCVRIKSGRVNCPLAVVGSGNYCAIMLWRFVARRIANLFFVKTIEGIQEDETDVKNRENKSGDPRPLTVLWCVATPSLQKTLQDRRERLAAIPHQKVKLETWNIGGGYRSIMRCVVGGACST